MCDRWFLPDDNDVSIKYEKKSLCHSLLCRNIERDPVDRIETCFKISFHRSTHFTTLWTNVQTLQYPTTLTLSFAVCLDEVLRRNSANRDTLHRTTRVINTYFSFPRLASCPWLFENRKIAQGRLDLTSSSSKTCLYALRVLRIFYSIYNIFIQN